MIADPGQRERLLAAFPFLRDAAPEQRAEFFAQASLARLAAGQTICQAGAQCALLPLVVSGLGRVYQLGENGREITLYRVRPGESCVLTASCILSGRAFPAFAECEREVEAAVVQPAAVRRWLASWDAWRVYLFDLIATRLQEVFGLLDAVLFQRLDQRLIACLLHQEAASSASASGPAREIRMTHQALAVELGSSREVISRVLKGLEAQGLLRAARGRIERLDRPGLEARLREEG